MRASMILALLATASLAACDSQPISPQDENVVNATRQDQAAPAGALGEETGNYAEGNITPAEQNGQSSAMQNSPTQ